MRGHLGAVGAQQVQSLRQVVLALGVVGREPRQRAEQRGSVEHVYAGVDLANPQLLVGGVARLLGLHDARHRPVGIAHDASVAAGIVEHRRGHRDRGPAARVSFDQVADRLSADQGDVAAEDHDGRIGVDLLGGRAHGAAGAVGLGLHGQLDSVGQDCRERAGGRVHHDDALGAGGQSRAHRPQHHRNAAQVVQHLGRGRAHARALPGGKDQDGGGGHRHDSIALAVEPWTAHIDMLIQTYGGTRGGVLGAHWGAGIRTPILRTKT